MPYKKHLCVEKKEENRTRAVFEHHRIIVDAKQSPYRIDTFLINRLPHTTRNKLQRAIEKHFILVNQQPIRPSYTIKPHDVIQVMLPTPPSLQTIQPENIPLPIVYEDAALLIVNKPAGMLVHPAHSQWTGTLVNALVYHFQNLPNRNQDPGKPGLVHRIDKDTSGLLVIAKTENSMMALAKQFFDHSITRTYYALVWGVPSPITGTIDVPIGRSLQDKRIMTTFPDQQQGKRAITHYHVIKPLTYVSLVQCRLETGRTHQIRTHMRSIGHPIFGDTCYGGDQILQGQSFSSYKAFVRNCLQLMPYQALHAQSLGFIHPVTQHPLYVEAPLPIAFQTVLARWEKYAQYHETL